MPLLWLTLLWDVPVVPTKQQAAVTKHNYIQIAMNSHSKENGDQPQILAFNIKRRISENLESL